MTRATGRLSARLARTAGSLLLIVQVGLGCALPMLRREAPRPAEATPPTIAADVLQRAYIDRTGGLVNEVERLRADLQRAEEALVAAESDLRGAHTRADAVSSLAEAQIEVERAARAAPWRLDRIVSARSKLEEADHQIQDGHFGAALFFVYRARRISEAVQHEAMLVSDRPATRFVRVDHVNLRLGPTTADPIIAVLRNGAPVFPEKHEGSWVLVRTTAGSVGWIHGRLLGEQTEPAPAAPAR